MVLFDVFVVVIVQGVFLLDGVVGVSFLLLGTTDTTHDRLFFLPPPSLSPLRPKSSENCLVSRLKAGG